MTGVHVLDTILAAGRLESDRAADRAQAARLQTARRMRRKDESDDLKASREIAAARVAAIARDPR